jgi:hypothetical protein
VALFAYAGIVKCDVPVSLVVNSELPLQYRNVDNMFVLVRDALVKAALTRNLAPCS